MGQIKNNVDVTKMRRLAGELLSMAAEEFSNHGCNDFERPDYFTPEEWRQLEVDFERYNSNGQDGPCGNMADWVLMCWCARLAASGQL
jgi:hypothetical protein